MKKANEDIRKAAKAANVRLWQIGEELGLADDRFSRKLRHELPEDMKQEILSIINKLSEVEENV